MDEHGLASKNTIAESSLRSFEKLLTTAVIALRRVIGRLLLREMRKLAVSIPNIVTPFEAWMVSSATLSISLNENDRVVGR
ncbi:MAG: hypothetical protein ACI9KM_000932, partial [Rubritalea sp.]